MGGSWERVARVNYLPIFKISGLDLHFKSGYDGYDFVPGEKFTNPGIFFRNSRAFDANKDFLKKFTHF